MQIKIMALAGVRDMYYSFTAVSNSCNCLKKTTVCKLLMRSLAYMILKRKEETH